MKKLMFLMAVGGLAAGVAGAAPTVSTPVINARPDGVIEIAYTLSGEDAVVTAEVTTNGVSIGAEFSRGFVGDVNREMAVGDHTIYWCPRNFWPNQYVADGSLKVVLTAWSKASPPDYMAQSIHTKSARFFYPTAEAVPLGVTNRLYKTNFLLMRRIHAAGVPWMAGLSENDPLYGSTMHLAHMVTLTNDYYIGVYETTLTQFKMVFGGVDNIKGGLIFGSGASQFTNEVVLAYPDSFVRPIDGTSWSRLRMNTSGGQEYYHWPQKGHAVNSSSPTGYFRKATGLELDLPTEAQWEFAARAGDGDAVPQDVEEMAWTKKNWEYDPMRVAYGGANDTHEVGLLKANAWGLYDMLGNAAEWCLDGWPKATPDPYLGAEVIEPIGPLTPASGDPRPARGGAYSSSSFDSVGPNLRWYWSFTAYKADGTVRYVCPAVLP